MKRPRRARLAPWWQRWWLFSCIGLGCSSETSTPRDAAPDRPDASRDAASDARDERDASRDADVPLDASADAAVVQPERGPDYLRFPPLEPSSDGLLEVSFVVPRGARSFVLTARPESSRRVQLVEMSGPTGVIYDALEEPSPTGPLARALTRNVEDTLPLSIAYPSLPDAPFEPGRYSVQLYVGDVDGSQPASVEIDVVLGPPVAEDAERRLGVQVWVASGASTTAEQVLEDRDILLALAGFREIFFDAAGIAIEDIALDDLGGEAMLAVVDGPERVAAIASELEGAKGIGLHLVLVERIEAGEGKTVLGKAMGVPGAPAHPMLPRRGAILLSLETWPRDPARAAEMIAHEAAHYLGLRHTSEADGMAHDGIADTPECPAERASLETTSGALVLSAEDCADFDGDNLMFYRPPLDDAPQRELSDDQVTLLRLSPTVL